MRIVTINEAEAIIEPYWDGGSSEHPTDKYSLLNEYRVACADGVQGGVFQQWHAVIVQIDRGGPGGGLVVMERACDVPIEDYDTFRVFIGMPAWMRLTVRATVDGQEQVVIDGAAGVDTNDEYEGRVSGRRLTALRLEFGLTEPKPAYASLFWLGLSNRAAEQRMEARLRSSSYGPDWPGALEPGLHTTSLAMTPEIGIFFGAEELYALRHKLTTGHLAPAYEALREQARKDMRLNPEAEIGRLVPWPLRIFARKRDMGKTLTAGVMERLAFVGLIERNLDMSIMAARMALSAAHCEHWCESPMGVFPGATWHHRSFTEEIYCRACALVLDWAGFCFTPHGRQVVRDAIIMKGLPRIESDFKRMEYIRHMNQGIVFSSGRIIGTLALLPAHPRYKGLVDEAERDVCEMVADYVRPDGGTLEGIAYWDYTFGTTMPLAYALARYRGYKDLRDLAQRGPQGQSSANLEGLMANLVKTGDYALGMLSITGDGTTYLPINDAHADSQLGPELVAAYCQISARPEWPNLYANMMRSKAATPDLYHLILAPAQLPAARPMVEPKFAAFPATGQVSAVRVDPSLGAALGAVHFHLCSGQAFWGHFDEDKGSFILEAGGQALAIDRGVSNYDHPEANLMGFASRHNLLYPEAPDGVEIHQPTDTAGARLTSSLDCDGIVLLASDNAQAWAAGQFATNVRRVVSPAPDLYVIDDQAATETPWAASFRLNSLCPIVAREDGYWVMGERASLHIVPLNWAPATEAVEPISTLGLDCHLKPVNLLWLLSPASNTHRLVTAIQVVPNGDPAVPLWQFERSGELITAGKGDLTLSLAVESDPALGVTVRRNGSDVLQATCRTVEWISRELP